jgi:hypothetical protein
VVVVGLEVVVVVVVGEGVVVVGTISCHPTFDVSSLIFIYVLPLSDSDNCPIMPNTLEFGFS